MEWRKLLENVFISELKDLYKTKDVLKSFTLFCQKNSPLLEHTAYKSAKYDCQGFLNLVLVLFAGMKWKSSSAAHDKRKGYIFLLRVEDQLY